MEIYGITVAVAFFHKKTTPKEDKKVSYKIITDSACDIKNEVLNEWGVTSLDLSFRFDGEDKLYKNSEMSTEQFYKKMKDGGVAKTSAVNPDAFAEAFEKELKEGNDVLYVGFSSGLSTTYNSARIAKESIIANYPDRKIELIDTLAASAGEGLLVYLAAQRKSEGATLEENRDYIESVKMDVSIWFTVDDLVYLKRGGRIGAASAFFGNMLGIKPILHMDEAGHLVAAQKVRGRRTAIDTLVKKIEDTAKDASTCPIFVSHAGCENEVAAIDATLNAKLGRGFTHITEIGPVIGSHAGPGTIAIFFPATER